MPREGLRSWKSQIPHMLEDDPCDVLRKAQRGTGQNAARLAQITGIEEAMIAAWTRGDGVPSEDEARAIAVPLRLDPGKFADTAARRYEPQVATPADVRHHPHDPHPS